MGYLSPRSTPLACPTGFARLRRAARFACGSLRAPFGRLRILAVLAALCLGLGAAPSGISAAAERSTPAVRAAGEGYGHELAHDLMSPFCPGRTLSDCPSPDAATLRAWILVQEAAGRSRADVEAELLERYGEQLLAAPRARGFGLTAYALPVGVFVGGGAVVALFLRRQTRQDRAHPRAKALPLSADLERLVDQELER